jgi:hypothetical protein
MLAIVQHEQEAPAAERLADRVDGRATRAITDMRGGCDCGTNAASVGDRGELDEPDAIGVLLEEIGSEVEGETGLATAAWSGQRQQPGRLKALNCIGDLALPSDELRRVRRQVVRGRVKNPERSEACLRCLEPTGDVTAGVEAELVSNLFDVVFSSALGDEEPLGDLAIRESVGDKLCHLLLAPA